VDSVPCPRSIVPVCILTIRHDDGHKLMPGIEAGGVAFLWLGSRSITSVTWHSVAVLVKGIHYYPLPPTNYVLAVTEQTVERLKSTNG
jgi:hypothetical protein